MTSILDRMVLSIEDIKLKEVLIKDIDMFNNKYKNQLVYIPMDDEDFYKDYSIEFGKMLKIMLGGMYLYV